MAIGTTAALVLGAGAFSAASQYSSGQAQSRAIKQKAAFDAQVYEQQAGMIAEKQKLENRRYARTAGRVGGSIIARTAGKGLGYGGSPLAVMIDAQSQIEMDRAIGEYNLEIQKRSAQTGADFTRIQGAMDAKRARYRGYTNAFSTLLGTATSVGMMGLTPKVPTTYGSIGRGINARSITSANVAPANYYVGRI